MDGVWYQLAFWVLAIVTVVSAGLITTIQNLARAVVLLVFFFLGIAGLFFMLQAEFLALVEVLIYATAVAVIFAFVIMLTPNLGLTTRQTVNSWWGAMISGLFLVAVLMSLVNLPGAANPMPAGPAPTLSQLGQVLLGDYLFPFELVSIVLLVALVGSILYTGMRGGGRDDNAAE